MLVYPTPRPDTLRIDYRMPDRSGSLPVVLIGLPFSVQNADGSKQWLREQLGTLMRAVVDTAGM